MIVAFTCSHCGANAEREAGAINRAHRAGRSLYCGRTCAGLARRLLAPKTAEQKKTEKRAYDAKRRADKAAQIKSYKRAYYEANRERISAQMAEYRAQGHVKHRHLEYLSRPEQRAKKSAYDESRRLMEVGEFAECLLLARELEQEIRRQASAYEVRKQNGYYTRNAQKRRRELWQLKQRN